MMAVICFVLLPFVGAILQQSYTGMSYSSSISILGLENIFSKFHLSAISFIWLGRKFLFYVCETLLGHQTNTLCRSTFYWKCLSSFFTVKVLYCRWDIISMPIFAINIVTLLCHLVYVISNMFTKFTQYKLMASHVCCWRNWLVPS